MMKERAQPASVFFIRFFFVPVRNPQCKVKRSPVLSILSMYGCDVIRSHLQADQLGRFLYCYIYWFGARKRFFLLEKATPRPDFGASRQ
jgi:hypothetical protein